MHGKWNALWNGRDRRLACVWIVLAPDALLINRQQEPVKHLHPAFDRMNCLVHFIKRGAHGAIEGTSAWRRC
jgi:hypothetical protein